jgi:rhodanese-related sulfurtransferase
VSFFIDNWTLVAVALASAAMLMWPTLNGGGGVGAIGPTDAVRMMNREKAVVVDVSEADEFKAGHVSGAKSLPLSTLEAGLTGVVKNKATPVILVCATGQRSKRAVAIAKKLGYENSHSLAGGLGAWRGASLPVDKS